MRTRLSRLVPLTCVLGLLGFAGPVPAQPASAWEWLSPLPQGNDLVAVAWHDKQGVAVGVLGAIVMKQGKSAWTAVPSGSSASLVDVCWNGTGWTAASDTGEILISRDGKAWEMRRPDLPGQGSVTNVAVLRGVTVLARGGGLLTSADLARWDLHPALETSRLAGLACSGKAVVAVGPRGTVVSTRDATRWKTRSLGEEDLVAVAWGRDRFVAVGARGGVFLSPDGDSWVRGTDTLDDSCRTLGWTGNRFVALGPNGAMRESVDGVTWTSIDVRGEGCEPRAVTGHDGQAVVVGVAGSILEQDSTWQWRVQTIRVAAAITSLAWDGHQWVALVNPSRTTIGGSFWLASSPDGRTWTTARDRPLGIDPRLAVAPDGTLVVLTESDLQTRLPDATWATTKAPPNTLTTVAWGGGRFVAVGMCGAVMRSRDGITWETSNAGTSLPLWSVAWTGSMWVAAGNWRETTWWPACRPSTDSAIFSSGDAVTWTRRATGHSTYVALRDIACSPRTCLAVGPDGQHAVSSDGVTWRAAEDPVALLNTVAWTGHAFLGVGPGGLAMTSADGTTWRPQPAVTTQNLQRIAANGQLTLVAGENGILLATSNQSPHVPRRRLSGGR
jgi:hypothetical protein